MHKLADKPIKWKAGYLIISNIGEVQFKISFMNLMLCGIIMVNLQGSVSVHSRPQADTSGIFNDVTDQYNILKEISDATVYPSSDGKRYYL